MQKMSENKKIKIRKFNEDDYIDCYINWCNDIDVVKFLSWNIHKDMNETKIVVNKWINDFNKGIFQFAITNNDNKPIGSIGITKIIDSQTIHIGYALSKKYWNQGITSYALKLFIDYIKNNTNYHIIETFCNKQNKASISVLKKNNFILVGETSEKIKDNFDYSHYFIFILKIK